MVLDDPPESHLALTTIWASARDFRTYRICEQQKVWRDCAHDPTCHSLVHEFRRVLHFLTLNLSPRSSVNQNL